MHYWLRKIVHGFFKPSDTIITITFRLIISSLLIIHSRFIIEVTRKLGCGTSEPKEIFGKVCEYSGMIKYTDSQEVKTEIVHLVVKSTFYSRFKSGEIIEAQSAIVLDNEAAAIATDKIEKKNLRTFNSWSARCGIRPADLDQYGTTINFDANTFQTTISGYGVKDQSPAIIFEDDSVIKIAFTGQIAQPETTRQMIVIDKVSGRHEIMSQVAHMGPDYYSHGQLQCRFEGIEVIEETLCPSEYDLTIKISIIAKVEGMKDFTSRHDLENFQLTASIFHRRLPELRGEIPKEKCVDAHAMMDEGEKFMIEHMEKNGLEYLDFD